MPYGPKLREAGDFKNDRAVEYATLTVSIPRLLLPINMQRECLGADENSMVRGLSVTANGRLTFKPIYLDSEELAFAFREHIHLLFQGRKYANDYDLEVIIKTTTETKTATKNKLRDSAAVRDVLAAKG